MSQLPQAKMEPSGVAVGCTGRLVHWNARRRFGFAHTAEFGRVRVPSSVVPERPALRDGDLVRLEVATGAAGQPVASRAEFLVRTRGGR
jgi:hypothetical protein